MWLGFRYRFCSVCRAARKGEEAGVILRTWKIGLVTALLVGVLPLPMLPIQPAGAATFTVTRTGDPTPDGCRRNDCSLREAVIAANNRSGPDTIRLGRGRYELTRPAPDENEARTGDLDISGNVTITGAGPNKTVIDANRNDRIFHISSNVEGKISDLAVKGGAVVVDEAQEQGGGGLLNLGRITLARTLFEDNQARVEARGAAISSEGRLVIKNSRITNNLARGDGRGGGIDYTGGRLVMRNSRVDHNKAAGSFGAGLYSDNSTGRLFDSKVDHNRLPSACCGGGVYAGEFSSFEAVNSSFNSNFVDGCCGSGLMADNAEVLLRRSEIRGNLVEGCCGGGVMAQDDSMVVLRDTLLAENRARGCCAGGLVIQSGSSAKLVNSRVLNNKVPEGCCAGGLLNQGANLTLIGTLVRGNQSLTGGGGGIMLQSSATGLVMKKSTVARNSTLGDGGGIRVSENASLDITNSTISGNSAGALGGGIWEDSTAGMTLTHVTITKNEAEGPGGGISTNGGTWSILGSIVANNTDDCNATLTTGGVNLDRDGSCFGGPGAIHAGSRLRPLANNGGATPTHVPKRSSPAVDAVPRPACPPPDRDQRDVKRPKNGDGQPGKKCDIGAVERKP